MTFTLPKFHQDFRIDFNKVVNVNETVKINKEVKAMAYIVGNIGNANADAKAFGGDTLAETLTLTSAIAGESSTAFSESTSATNGAVWFLSLG